MTKKRDLRTISSCLKIHVIEIAENEGKINSICRNSGWDFSQIWQNGKPREKRSTVASKPNKYNYQIEEN